MDVPPFVARLLGLPEDAADPTAYQLLGLDPRRFAPEQVQPALEERKRRLRQNIPGPQFIPIVSRFEQELDRVAALLLDPRLELLEILVQGTTSRRSGNGTILASGLASAADRSLFTRPAHPGFLGRHRRRRKSLPLQTLPVA